MVCLTYPHIGNVGANLDDEESAKPHIESLIVREFSRICSNWRSAETAQLYLNRHKIPVIWDIDTRALVRHLRQFGALRGIVATDGTPADQCVFEARQVPTMAGQELASRVSCNSSYKWETGSIDLATSPWSEQTGEAGANTDARRLRVVAYDYGIKQNILRLLVDHHCEVAVFRTAPATPSQRPTPSKAFASCSGGSRFSVFAWAISCAAWLWAARPSS
jgi:carbamoyl-phosphate synthase small subunit